MKTDLTKQFFELCERKENTKLIVTLKNRKVYKGVPVSFVMGNAALGEPFILKVHLVPEEMVTSFGLDSLGKQIGFLISVEDISIIHFEEDKYELKIN